MKKLFILTAIVITTLFTASCHKGDTTPELDDRLVGTKWQTSDHTYKLFYGGNPYEVFEFISTTELECYITNNGKVVKSNGIYTYSLEYPHITINIGSSSGTTPTKYTFKDSRTMVRDGWDEYTPYAKYIRQ